MSLAALKPVVAKHSEIGIFLVAVLLVLFFIATSEGRWNNAYNIGTILQVTATPSLIVTLGSLMIFRGLAIALRSGWSTAPHFDLSARKSSAGERKAFLKAFAGRGLEVISLNADGNPLHPTDGAQDECLKDTIRVAGEMGIKTVCAMSGLPAGSANDEMPNWIVSSWPPETQAILRYQWEDKLLPFWTEIVAVAREARVEKIAL